MSPIKRLEKYYGPLHNFFIHLSVGSHSDCLHIVTFLKKILQKIWPWKILYQVDAGWLNAQKRDYEIHTSSGFNFFGSTHADFCTSCSGLYPLQQYTRIFFSLSSHEYLFSFHALIVAIHKSGADLRKFWFSLLCKSCVKHAFTTLLCICHGNETLCRLEIGYSFIVLEVNCVLWFVY